MLQRGGCGQKRIGLLYAVRICGQMQIGIAAYRMQTEIDRIFVCICRQMQVKCDYIQDANRSGYDLLLQMQIFYPLYVVFADRTDNLQLEADRNPVRFCPLFLSGIASSSTANVGTAIRHKNQCQDQPTYV